eukprot:UN33609
MGYTSLHYRVEMATQFYVRVMSLDNLENMENILCYLTWDINGSIMNHRTKKVIRTAGFSDN